jgi:hypothetical protein
VGGGFPLSELVQFPGGSKDDLTITGVTVLEGLGVLLVEEVLAL